MDKTFSQKQFLPLTTGSKHNVESDSDACFVNLIILMPGSKVKNAQDMEGIQACLGLNTSSQGSWDETQKNTAEIKLEGDQTSYEPRFKGIMGDYVSVNVNTVLDLDFELLETNRRAEKML